MAARPVALLGCSVVMVMAGRLAGGIAQVRHRGCWPGFSAPRFSGAECMGLPHVPPRDDREDDDDQRTADDGYEKEPQRFQADSKSSKSSSLTGHRNSEQREQRGSGDQTQRHSLVQRQCVGAGEQGPYTTARPTTMNR